MRKGGCVSPSQLVTLAGEVSCLIHQLCVPFLSGLIETRGHSTQWQYSTTCASFPLTFHVDFISVYPCHIYCAWCVGESSFNLSLLSWCLLVFSLCLLFFSSLFLLPSPFSPSLPLSLPSFLLPSPATGGGDREWTRPSRSSRADNRYHPYQSGGGANYY